MANELHGRRTHEKPVPREPDLPHATRTQPRDQTVAADGHRFVQLLLVHFEHRAPAKENGAFQNCSELADVSGPAVSFEPTHRVCRYTIDYFSQPSCVPPHEMIDERRYVLAPVGERGHIETVRGKQLKQRQESARRRLTHIMRGRGDEPNAGFLEFAAAPAIVISFQSRVKRALKILRQFVHRIEEHRTA